MKKSPSNLVKLPKEEKDATAYTAKALPHSMFQLPGVIIRSNQRLHSLFEENNKARRTFPMAPIFNQTKSALKSTDTLLQEQDEGIVSAPASTRLTPNVLHNLPAVEDCYVEDGYRQVRDIIFAQAKQEGDVKMENRYLNFLNIVDINDDSFKDHIARDYASRFGDGQFFRIGIILVIFANAIFIGLQTDPTFERNNLDSIAVIENIFQGIFIMEILLKWYYGFTAFWKVGWNIFDFFIVAATLLGPTLTFLTSGRVLRVLRVLRAFRTIKSFAGIQVIVATVLESIPDMANIVLLLLIVTFIFSVVGVTLFEEYDQQNFGDLGKAFFTLFICITQDGWVDIFDGLEAQGQFVPAGIYFSLFVIIGAFVFANLVVAVVVTNLEMAFTALKKQNLLRNRNLISKDSNDAIRQVTDYSGVSATIFESQIPLEIPDFDRISTEKVENYLLLLSIIEENLREYLMLKGELQNVLSVLQGIASNIQEEDDDESLIGTDMSDEDEKMDAGGDIMTQLIRAQGQGK